MALADTTEDGGGEGYFASASDLMVGILFIFLLMLTVFALNFRDAEHDQKIELARYEAAKREAEGAKREAEMQAKKADEQLRQNDRLRQLLKDLVSRLEQDLEDRVEVRRRLLESLRSSLEKQGVRVSIDPASGILRLSEELLFDVGESSVSNEKLPALATLTNVLASILPCYLVAEKQAGCDRGAGAILETVLVEGHADRHKFQNMDAQKSERKNDELSTQRALSVFERLWANPSLAALRNPEGLPLLGMSGYGARRPVADDFQKNRRIDLRFVLSARSSDEIVHLRDEIQKTIDGVQ